MKTKIPKEIIDMAVVLSKNGYEAYLVGGCVRDILRRDVYGELVEPKDYDIATDARPEGMLKIFPESKYENDFGTVLVKTESEDEKLKVVEVTTFRIEGKYSDKRHPDEVKFAKTIEEDLSRRDFTVNAMALKCDANIRMHANDANECELIDPYGGEKDLKKKIIRAVGEPEKRFA